MNLEVTPLKKKKSRLLSRFMAQELLYEYVVGHLDEERKQALIEFIPDCDETKSELENLERGIQICDELKNLKMDTALIDSILNMRSKGERAVQSLNPKNWPDFLRWGLEALGISILVAGIAITLPWSKFAKLIPQHPNDITLVEAKKEKIVAPVAVAAAPVAIPLTEAPVIKPPDHVKELSAAQIAKDEALEEGPPAKGPAKGVLFRAFMAFEDTEQVGDQIRAAILSLGGLKAGTVELGWHKPGGKYYHFKIPQANFEALKNRLEAVGPVRISKESHPRVMPQGQIRIILWVEDKSLQQ